MQGKQLQIRQRGLIVRAEDVEDVRFVEERLGTEEMSDDTAVDKM